MADLKISELTNLTAADPVSDMLPIVDVSATPPASGSTKRISINNLLSSSPTASGALTVTGLVTAGSATITGDLTVRTNKLAVTSTGVGIVQATPLYPLHLVGEFGLEEASAGNGSKLRMIGQSTKYNFRLGKQIAVDNAFEITPSTAVGGTTFTNPVYTVTYDGTHTFLDGTGGTRMTLNSTGLGVGVTPTIAKVQTNGAFATNGAIGSIGANPLPNALITDFSSTCRLIATGANTVTAGVFKFINASSNANIYLESITLDASGNLLIGKTTSLFSTVGVEASQAGFLGLTNSASTNAATNLSLYSTGAAAFRFYVGLAGTVFATNTTISAISDARLKENVQDIDVGLGAILALKPRKFDWKAGKGKDIKGDRGFIAQEFEMVFPNLIDEWKDNAPEGEAPYKSVRQDLIPVLVKAIQELTARVQTLEAR